MDRRRFLQLLGAGAASLAVGPAGLVRAQEAGGLLVAGRQARVATDMLNVRGGPSAGDPLVGSLAGDAAVDLLAPSADGAWWRVASNQFVGYVAAPYLQPTGAPAASDAFDLDLAIPYARQLTAVWCDPADVEMWMGYHGMIGDAPSYGRQQALWDWETGQNAGFTVDQWNCSPYAVASAARQWMPDFGFDHFRHDDQLAGTRLLAWQLANPASREPAIALIWRGEHYVLIRGVRALGDPGQDPNGARILGFYVADPNRGDRSWLGQDRYIPIDRWLGELFTPATYRTPHTGVPGDVWQDRYVTIQRTQTGDGPTLEGQLNATP
ncbi:MAG: hypothetical protein QOF51_1691 [Chloroflexota bacterium]|jgi:hypothetical protein|nr:hypothetical protein [Chloroflexota bacterium]